MKLKLLFVYFVLISATIQAENTTCSVVFNDTFDESGSLPSEWTEYNTIDSITVVDGYMKFNHSAEMPSAYRTFDPVSNDFSFSFDVEASRNSAQCLVNILSSDGKYIASIDLGCTNAYVKYATSMSGDTVPGDYTDGVIDGRFKTNTLYSISLFANFETQTIDFYSAGELTLESIPFLESVTDISKIDIQLLYMYSDNGTFLFDNIRIAEGSEASLILMDAITSAEKLLDETSIEEQYAEVVSETFEKTINDANTVLNSSDASTETLTTALTDLQDAKAVFESRLTAITAITESQELLSNASVGDHYVQYPQSAVDIFEQAINDADSIITDTEASIEELTTTVDSLEAANTTFTNSHNDPVALKLYSLYNFNGDVAEFKCGYYNGTLGDFEDKAVSFELDSGYMATFAQDVDGLGVSKVYIAQDRALAINLPAELQRSISFVRVSPWYSVGKKGSLGSSMSHQQNLNTSWHYTWGLNVPDPYYEEAEFVPMSWSGGDNYVSPSVVQELGANMKLNHHLAFNEPDLEDQSNMTVERALELYPSLLASGLRLGAPAVSNLSYSLTNSEFNEGAWIIEFMDSCVARGYRVDFIPVHDYVRRSPSQYITRFQALSEKYNLPIWVTEYNYGNPNMGSADIEADDALSNLEAITDKFEETDFIERYAWYYFFSNTGAYTDGELNERGIYYRDLETVTPSYIQEVYEDGPYVDYGEATSLDEIENNGLKVTLSPNPATGDFIKVLYPKSIGVSADYSITIYDICGRVVLSQNHIQEKIDISGLNNGLYFVKVESEDFKVIEKITVIK